MSIGSKIKKLRKKRGMTQAVLSDGIVTRGMLSRIENGSAMPSMQSLESIAKRLEVSPSFLLEDGEDIFPAELARVAKAIEDEYRAKNFENCLNIFSLWQLENDTKFAAVFVPCAFEVALDSFFSGDFAQSKELLKKIQNLLPSLLVSLSEVNERRICFLRSVMDNIDCIDHAIELANDCPDFEFSPSLFFSLLKLLKSGKTDDCKTLLRFCVLDTNYKEFIDAQLAVNDYRFIDAILTMKGLSLKQSCPVFLKLLCLASMENCCKLCDDYKGAYENHLAYQSLLSEIKR